RDKLVTGVQTCALPISKTGDGIPGLRDELTALLPEGPRYFPVEQRSDLPLELQVAELVREKALWLTKDEVPHAITVEVDELDERSEEHTSELQSLAYLV